VHELRQTSIIGAARLNGSQKVGLDLGIVTKSKEGQPGSFPMGLGKEFYAFTDPSEDVVDQFLGACRAQSFHPEFASGEFDPAVFAALLSASISSVASTIGGAMTNPDSMNHTTVVRKAVIAELIVNSDCVKPGVMTVANLQKWCPDEKDNLSVFPGGESAEEISALVLRRPDHGMFLSMWACLWGMVLDKFWVDEVKQAFLRQGLANEIRRHVALHGVPPHPYNAALRFCTPKPIVRKASTKKPIANQTETPKALAKARTKTARIRPAAAPSSSSKAPRRT